MYNVLPATEEGLAYCYFITSMKQPDIMNCLYQRPHWLKAMCTKFYKLVEWDGNFRAYHLTNRKTCIENSHWRARQLLSSTKLINERLHRMNASLFSFF